MWKVTFVISAILFFCRFQKSAASYVSAPPMENTFNVELSYHLSHVIQEGSPQIPSQPTKNNFQPNHRKSQEFVLGYFCGNEDKNVPTYKQSYIFEAATQACEALGNSERGNGVYPEWYTAMYYKLEGPYIQWPLIRKTGRWGKGKSMFSKKSV